MVHCICHHGTDGGVTNDTQKRPPHSIHSMEVAGAISMSLASSFLPVFAGMSRVSIYIMRGEHWEYICCEHRINPECDGSKA